MTAAAIHLGWLEPDRVPTKAELMALPYFDKTSSGDFGVIRFMGHDDCGDEVYVMSKKRMGQRAGSLLSGIAKIMGCESEVMLVDTLVLINPLVMLGGFASRRLGWTGFGRPILFYGMNWAFPGLTAAVRETKRRLQSQSVDTARAGVSRINGTH